MDVFERVREVNRGAGLNEERITAARARLLTGIDAGASAERKRITRRPMFVIAGAVAGVAAATAGVVVISQLNAPAPQVEAIPTATASPRPQTTPTPEPSATSGPVVTEPYPGTTPQQGQYLRIVTTDDALMYRGPGATVYQWNHRPYDFPPISAALMRTTSQLYVPADRTGDWISSEGPKNERLQFFSQDVSGGNQVAWDNMYPFFPQVQEWSSPGGALVGGGDGLHGSLESYAGYPTDPQALLQLLRDQMLAAGYAADEVDEVVVQLLIEELTFNFAPPVVRAAFVGALALSDRTEVVATNGTVVTYRLRVTAVSVPQTQWISIDTATGWVTEHSSRFDRTAGADQDMVPSDVPDIRRTFTVSIVDALP